MFSVYVCVCVIVGLVCAPFGLCVSLALASPPPPLHCGAVCPYIPLYCLLKAPSALHPPSPSLAPSLSQSASKHCSHKKFFSYVRLQKAYLAEASIMATCASCSSHPRRCAQSDRVPRHNIHACTQMWFRPQSSGHAWDK